MSLVIGLLVITAIAVSGCGERTESAKFYYSPSWARDGSVIFVLGLQTTRKDAIGTQTGSSYTEGVTTMDATGAGETFRFDVTGAPPSAMSFSPTTDYLAYLDGLRSGLYGKLVIRNIAGGTHTGLENIELAFSPGIKSFDWSNDASKLVYCTTTEVRTVKPDGTADALVTAEANLEFVTWKYGGRIAFVYTSGGVKRLALIYADGSGRTDLAAAASVDKPQISTANTNEVYGIAGGSYCKVNVSAGVPATTEVKANFTGNLPRLSPSAVKVVYDKVGEQSGIYMLDIATGTETKIK